MFRRNFVVPTLLMAGLAVCGFQGAARAQNSQPAQAPAPEMQKSQMPAAYIQPPMDKNSLTGQVHHALAMLPYYTVFDNLAYKVKGTKVILLGQVTQPVLKDSAENAVKSVKGVTQVVDKIQVLPLSPMDDQTRMAEYHAIYDFPSLSHYGVGAERSIRIIVDNGHVTLVGVVDSKTDADTATVRANGVPNVFSVTNQLQVAGS